MSIKIHQEKYQKNASKWAPEFAQKSAMGTGTVFR